MFTLIILALIQCILLAGGQAMLKCALNRIDHFEWSWSFVGSQLTNWWFLAAGITLGAATVLWMCILRKYPLSQAYPVTALSYVVNIFIAMIFFGESVPILHWIGVLLIVGGCIMLVC